MNMNRNSKERIRIHTLGRLIRAVARARFDLVPVPPSSIVLCDECGLKVERCQCETTNGEKAEARRVRVLSV